MSPAKGTRARDGSDVWPIAGPARILVAGVVAGASVAAGVGLPASPREQTPPPAAAGGGGTGAAQYMAQCAGCHGTDLAGGRVRSLFDELWLAKTSDDRLIQAIRGGVPGTEMPGFGASLSDRDLWQLVQYIRSRAGTLAPRRAFVADPDGASIATTAMTLTVEVVARGLETPWAMAFLPDGRMLVTERPGRLRVIDRGSVSAPVTGTPVVHEQQDGGLFDVEVHPQYAANGWIYLAYSEVRPGFVPPAAGVEPKAGRGRGRGPAVPSMTVVVRGRVTAANEWTDQQVVFRAPESLYTPSGSHFGSRMIFDGDGHLFFTIGERGAMSTARDLSNPLGKIHRIHDDGRAPSDNPFAGTAGAVATIWSYGHRNPEGLAWDPATGLLWESEHGPTGGDEINVIDRGHDYGWSLATKGTQNGVSQTSAEGADDPIVYFTPTLAPAGMTFVRSDRYPAWKNTSLFVGGLAGQKLLRLEIDGRRVIGQEVVFDQFGRVRDVVEGPDGYLYVALQQPTGSGTGVSLAASTPGIVVRLVPAR